LNDAAVRRGKNSAISSGRWATTTALRPRDPEGKFAKSITLKLTGTSRLTTVTTQKRGGKPVLVQRETDGKELQVGQPIAVIYAKEGMVLLAAVVEPIAEKPKN
jgi:hypothetical protein